MPRETRLFFRREPEMNDSLTKEEKESPVSALVHIRDSNAPQIVEGGCYHGSSPLRAPSYESRPNYKPIPRRWVAVLILVLMAILALVLWRRFSRQ
jgi:hypothetical protein